jgi:ribosome-binding factor A
MTIRQQKVAAQIRRLVSVALLKQTHDPRIGGLVTVTRVEVTPDLKEARIYVSILKTHGSAATVMHGLESATRWLQEEIQSGLPMRTMPRLSFKLDETLKKEAELLRQIDAVSRERQEHESGAAGTSGEPTKPAE